MALAVACADSERPLAPSAVVVAEFEGFVDPGSNTIRLRVTPTDAGSGLGVGGGVITQALDVIPEDQNGVAGTAAGAGRVEFVVECNGVPGTVCSAPFAPPATVVGGCGDVDSFEFDVTLRSFFGEGLVDAHAELTSITPVSQPQRAPTAYAFCNSDRTSPNRHVDGVPLQNTLGLARYGNLTPDDNPAQAGPFQAGDTVRWKWRAPGGTFSFRGRVTADPCDGDCTVGRVTTAFPAPEGTTLSASVDVTGEGQGTAYLGGSFSYVGPRTGSSAALDPVSGDVDATWPAVEGGEVLASLDDGASVYLGGTFTSVGGVARPGLARVFYDGTLDAAFTPPAVDGAVRALATDGARLFIGGSFLTVGTTSRQRVAALNLPSGALNPAWDANANNTVHALLVHQSFLYVGGAFTQLKGAARERVGRVIASTGAASNNWAPRVRTSNSTVFTLAATGPGATANIVAGGDFTQVQGPTGGAQTRNRLAAFSVAAGAVTTWDPNLNSGAVMASLVHNGLVYVVGSFRRGDQRRLRAAAYSLTTPATEAPWDPSLGEDAYTLARSADGETVYIGGDLVTVNLRNGTPVARDRVAAFDAATGVARPFTATVGPHNSSGATASAVRALVVTPARVVAGGAFRSVGGEARNGLSQIDLATGQMTPWSANLPAGTAVRFVHEDRARGHVLVAGNGFIGAYDRDTGAARWQHVVRGEVRTAAYDDAAGIVYAGGVFTSINNVNRENVGAVDVDTGEVLAWRADTALDSFVNAIALYGNDVYVGGFFFLIDGRVFPHLAAVPRGRTNTNVRRNIFVGIFGSVNALTPWRDMLLVGGNFTSVEGNARTHVAALLRDTVTPLSIALNGPVTSIAADGNAITLAGSFTTVDGVSCANVCVRNANGPSFGVASLGLTAPARSLATVGAGLVVGGAFTNVALPGGTVRSGLLVAHAD